MNRVIKNHRGIVKAVLDAPTLQKMADAAELRREREWPGGDIEVTLTGDDVGKGGSAVLHAREVFDSTHGRGFGVMREYAFRDPGPHRMNLPPCVYFWEVAPVGDRIPAIAPTLKAAPSIAKPPRLEGAEVCIAELEARIQSVEQLSAAAIEQAKGNASFVLAATDELKQRVEAVEASRS